uniref:Uncharacterized protein n=1 Tax=Aegilops tauschii TaxID=37682 RepID=N1QYL4_AEGTA
MENQGAAAGAAAPEKEAQAPASTCFKWTVGEGASLMERAKDQYRQFTEAQASEHWECIKNKLWLYSVVAAKFRSWIKLEELYIEDFELTKLVQ